MTFHILGPLRFDRDGEAVSIGAAKERLLLGVLLLEQGQVVSVERLVDELWGEQPPQQPVSSLRVLASRLRRVLAAAGYDDRMRTVPPGYMISLGPDELDAARFRMMVHEGSERLATNDPEGAAAGLREALGLWQGDVLADVELAGESRRSIRRLDDDRLLALESRIIADLRCGKHATVIGELEDLVVLHPLRENLWHQLVLALARAGRHAEALRCASRLRDALGDVGLDPSPDFVALEAAVAAHSPQLQWEPPPVAAEYRTTPRPPAPLPRALAQGRLPSLIGRRNEIARMLSIFASVAGGENATVLISGEPGVGKTSLTTEVAALAHDRGATVLYGQCDEDLHIAYQPFRQALQDHLSKLSSGSVEALLDRWPRLQRLAGPWGDRNDPAQTSGSDAEGERVLLFESVEGWLHELAQEAPVVLVIDDLHWASGPTVQLLRHLSHLRWRPLLCIATFRDTDVAETSGIRDMLAGVHRQANIHRLSLHGLDRDGVAQVVEERVGRVLDGTELRLADRIHDETGGNPFFATELVRHLYGTVPDGGQTPAVRTENFQLPDGVRDVIRQRVERLSPATNQVLRVAATIGPVSPFVLLATVPMSGDTAGLLDALDEATAARLLVETIDADYVFAHALVRKTIYGSLSAARRRETHRAVGEALLVLPTPLSDQNVALAHHFCQGAGPGDGARAARYALLAGREALDQVAHEMALEQFQRGLEVLERYGPPDPALRADLWIGVAEACNRGNDHHGRGRAAWQAAEAAREAGSTERLAWAAYWSARFGIVGSLDQRVVDLCDEALNGLGAESPALKARVMGMLASVRALAGEGVEADPLSTTAVELARASGDPVALVEALDARYTTLAGSPNVARRLEVAQEMVDVAGRCNDLSALGDGHRFRASARLISGDREGFDEDFAAMSRLGEQMRDGFLTAISAQWRATVALLDGRFVDVETQAGEAVELSGQDPNFVNAWAAQLVWAHHEQGRLLELMPLLESTVQDNPGIVGFRAALAMACATTGQEDAASGLLHEIIDGRPQPIPLDWIRTATLTLCAEAAAALRDRRAAEQLDEPLRSYSGQLVVVATGTHCQGAVDRFLGMLAAVRGEYPQAESYLSSALALEERARTPPNAARTRLWYARTLLASGENADVARELASEAAATAERLGMRGVAADARGLLDEASPGPANGVGTKHAFALIWLKDWRAGVAMGAALEFEILGPLRVRAGAEEVPVKAPMERLLVGVLCLEQSSVVSVDRLLDELWGSRSLDDPIASLRVLIARVRRRLGAAGDGEIRRIGAGYALRLSDDQIDAERFRGHVARGNTLAERGSIREALGEYDAAISLWRGDVLCDLPLGVESLPSIERLEAERLTAIEQRAEVRLSLGEHNPVIGELQEMVDHNPVRERFSELLMVALARSGRHAEALRVGAALRSALSQVGVVPAGSLDRLEREILEHDPGMLGATSGPPRPALRLVPSTPPNGGPDRPGLVRALPSDRSGPPGVHQPVPLVGRSEELAQLERWRTAAWNGQLSVGVVSGDAGVGKTRLVTAFAEHAREAGWQVLYGACDMHRLRPFHCVVEAIYPLLGNLDPDQRAELAMFDADELGRPKAASEHAAAERAEGFAELVSVLESISRDAPILLVLDDVQWIDPAAAAAMRFVLRSARSLRAVVILCAREHDVEPGSVPADLLAEAAQAPVSDHLGLEGLSEPDVVELVQALNGGTLSGPERTAAHRVWRRSGGNAFVAAEWARDLIARQGLAQLGAEVTDSGGGAGTAREIPSGAPAFLAERTIGLLPDLRRVLHAAAVLGPEFSVSLLSEVADAARTPEALEVAEQRRLIAAVDQQGSRFRFTHALIHEALISEVPVARRIFFHDRIAVALEARQSSAVIQELAFHSLGAAPLRPARAITHCVAAADAALGALGFEEAARLYERANELIDAGAVADRICRADVAYGIALCTLWTGSTGFDGVWARAVDAARAAGDAFRLAKVSLLVPVWSDVGVTGAVDDLRREVAAETLAMLPDGNDALRSRVMAALARQSPPDDSRADLISQCVALAELCGDPRAQLDALTVVSDLSGPDFDRADLARRADQLVSLSEGAIGGREASVLAALEQAHIFATHDRDRLGMALSESRRRADRAGQPQFKALVSCWEVDQLILSGPLDLAEERFSVVAEEIASSGMPPMFALLMSGNLLGMLRYHQGRLAELEGLAEMAAGMWTGSESGWAFAAMAALEAGNEERAREVVDRLAAADFVPIVRDALWLPAIAILGIVAARIDHPAVPQILSQLEPFSGRWGWEYTVTVGPIDFGIGSMHLACGRPERATWYLDRAFTAAQRVGAHVWEGWANLELARAQAALGRFGDADSLRRDALALADRGGFGGVTKAGERFEPRNRGAIGR